MLRLWTDRINIYLHPDQIVLVREVGVLRRRIADKEIVHVTDSENDPWFSVLSCLKSVLQENRWKGGNAHVILSDRFARFLTVPWDERLTKSERDVLLQHRFADIYGSDFQAARMAVADVGYGKQSIACAVSSVHLDALEAVCKNAGTHLVSVKPFLMSALNRLRSGFDVRSAWLVLAERSCLTLGLVQDGEWRCVRCMIPEEDWVQHLDILLEREELSCGAEASNLPVYVFWPENPDIKPELANGRPVVLLKLSGSEGYSPLADRAFVPAMCG